METTRNRDPSAAEDEEERGEGDVIVIPFREETDEPLSERLSEQLAEHRFNFHETPWFWWVLDHEASVALLKAASATLLCLLFLASSARAESPAALALYEEGRAALAAGDLDTACARFRASNAVEPGAGTWAHLGDCEARRGRIASAWEAFVSARKKLAPGDERLAKVQSRIDDLEPRLPRLQLTPAPGSPAELVVTEGTSTIGSPATWGIALPHNPGLHHLVVAAPGRPSRALDVTLAEGKTLALDVSAEPAASPPAPFPGPRAPQPPPGLPTPRRHGPGAGPWVLGGIGGAGLVTALAAGIVTAHEHAVASAGCSSATMTCTQTGHDAVAPGRTAGSVTIAGLVVGGAGLAGAGLWLGLGGRKAPARVGVAGSSFAAEGSW